MFSWGFWSTSGGPDAFSRLPFLAPCLVPEDPVRGFMLGTECGDGGNTRSLGIVPEFASPGDLDKTRT